MPMKPELKAWLDSQPFSPEVRKLLEPELEKDDIGNKVAETVMMRSDYSRALNRKDEEVNAYKTAAAQQEEQRKQEWAAFKANEEKKVKSYYDSTQAQLQAHQNQLRAYESKLTELVNQGLITQEEASIAYQQQVQQQPQQQAPTKPNGNGAEPRFVEKDAFNKSINDAHLMGVHATARINDLADQHFDLFGERLNRQELVNKTLEVCRQRAAVGQPEVTVEQVWRQTYGVDDKRAELDKAAREAEIKSRVEEALVQERSRAAVEGEARPYSGLDDPTGGHKHILSLFSSAEGQHRGTGYSPGVTKAAEAWRAGKLGQKQTA